MRFNILTNVLNLHAKIVADHAMNHSLNARLEKKVRKNDVVNLTKEAEMLSLPTAASLTTSGLNIKMR